MITSFRHDRAARIRKRIRLAVLAGSVLLVFLVEAFFSGSIARLLAGIARPFWVARDWAADRTLTVSAYFASKDALLRENIALEAALDRAAVGSMTREALRAENALLREALGRSEEYDMLLAAILVRPDRSPYDTLVIDIGADAGVVPGAKVFADGEFVIGEVSRVYRRSAVVSLYSSPGWQLSVLVGTSSISAMAEGEGGGNFRTLLPRGIEVAEGAVISIPSLGPEFVGIVERIERPESSSFQRIYFKLPFNIQEERYVYVALPSTPLAPSATREDETSTDL